MPRLEPLETISSLVKIQPPEVVKEDILPQKSLRNAIISQKVIDKAVAALKGKNDNNKNVITKQRTPILNHEDSSTMLG